MKTIRKLMSIILATFMLLSSLVAFNFAQAAVESDTPYVLHIDSVEQLVEHYQEFNNTDMIYLSAEELDTNFVELLNEVIDNGTDVMVMGNDIAVIAELFDYSLADAMEDYIVLGAYLSAIGGFTPITADIMIPEDEALTDSDLEELRAELEDAAIADALEICVIEIHEILDISVADLEFLNQISDESMAALQTQTPIGVAHTMVTHFRNFFKQDSLFNWGTTYQWSASNSIAGWERLGSINIRGFVVRLRAPIGTATFDNIYSIVTATGIGRYHVREYRFEMRAGTSAQASILDETWLTGNINSNVSVSIASAVSSNGLTTTTTRTYSFNPQGQRITNNFGNQNRRIWTAAPASNTADASWRLEPSITVRSGTGTTNTTGAVLAVDRFQVSGGIRTYTITATTSAILAFRNNRPA